MRFASTLLIILVYSCVFQVQLIFIPENDLMTLFLLVLCLALSEKLVRRIFVPLITAQFQVPKNL